MSSYEVPPFHRLIPQQEIENRLSAFQKTLEAQGLDGALIVYPTDLYYYSGTMQSAHLFIPARGEPLLMIRRHRDRGRAETRINDVVDLNSFRELPRMAADRLGREVKKLGLEMDVLPVNRYAQYQGLWPEAEFADVSPMILDQRMVKSTWEADCMRRAGELSRLVYGQVPRLMKPGQTEIELAGLITSVAYAGGHQNHLRTRAFDRVTHTWHVIGGDSGGILSYIVAPFGGYGLSPAFPVGASTRELKANEPILLDFGICVDGYQVDLTRMYSIGQPDGLFLEAYEALKEIEACLMDNLRPGATGDELFHLSRKKADELGFAHAFLGPEGQQVSFVGHGVGME